MLIQTNFTKKKLLKKLMKNISKSAISFLQIPSQISYSYLMSYLRIAESTSSVILAPSALLALQRIHLNEYHTRAWYSTRAYSSNCASENPPEVPCLRIREPTPNVGLRLVLCSRIR